MGHRVQRGGGEIAAFCCLVTSQLCGEKGLGRLDPLRKEQPDASRPCEEVECQILSGELAGPSSELTADPFRLRVVDLEIVAEEIFHCDLLLLR